MWPTGLNRSLLGVTVLLVSRFCCSSFLVPDGRTQSFLLSFVEPILPCEYLASFACAFAGS